MTNILVIGGGFAGVWAAASAVRLRNETGVDADSLSVTLVCPGDDIVIRPRLYESDPHLKRASLDRILGPIGVRRIVGTVIEIDSAQHSVGVIGPDGRRTDIGYDRLVLASGSHVVRPSLAGGEHLFDVDTLAGAAALDSHLRRLPEQPESDGRYTAMVVGAGFTGLEVATELTGRIRDIAGRDAPVRVILVERENEVGPELGPGPRPVIEQALKDLDVEVRLGVSLASVSPNTASLSDGAIISTSTVVWTCGMVASPLTALIPGSRDDIGRLVVDEFLRVRGVADVYAAGDTAAAMATEGRVVMQSCQHATPQGKFVGHNAAADILGRDQVAFEPVPYVTCLDLGSFGTVVTSGWEREVQMWGMEAKHLKQTINSEWICPPVDDAVALLAAAAPVADWPEYSPPNPDDEPIAFGQPAAV